MRKFLPALLFTFILLAQQAAGQSFKEQFRDLGYKQDSLGQIRLLEKWEDTDSNDPELYVAYFNYYVKLSSEEILQLGNNPKQRDALQLQKEGQSEATPAAFIYSELFYANNLLEKGLDYIDKGIAKFPDRLDMRFGKIYMLGETEDYAGFTQAIINVINHGHKIQNKWLWSDHKPLEEPKEVMLASVQDYVVQLYNTGDDKLLDNMKLISEAVLKYYPSHFQSLSNVSIVHMIRGEHDQALVALLKAEKIAPTDHIVLSNIAQAYRLKGDKKSAIKYYEKTIKYGEGEVKQNAREQIQVLKKN